MNVGPRYGRILNQNRPIFGPFLTILIFSKMHRCGRFFDLLGHIIAQKVAQAECNQMVTLLGFFGGGKVGTLGTRHRRRQHFDQKCLKGTLGTFGTLGT